MDIARTLSNLKKLTFDNSPLILTGVAVAGVVTTTVLAVKATFQAAEVIQEEHAVLLEEVGSSERMAPMTSRYKAELVWKLYIPAVATGVSTIACVVGANTISTRRNAALVSVYSLTETAFKEYRAKVAETIGDTKAQKIRDEVAKDRIDKNPVSNSEVIITGGGEQLCYESMSGRYFKSDMETIRRAMNDINARVINDMSASQNEFNDLIGLASTTYGEEVGWNLDHMLDIIFTAHLADDGRPCISLDYSVQPVRGFYKIN